jgi:hypothetical protein
VNLNIKPAQSFKYTHINKIYIYMFIGVSDRTYINIYVCNVFLKQKIAYCSKCILHFTVYSVTLSPLSETYNNVGQSLQFLYHR